MGFERCKVGRPSGIRHGLSWENMPPGRSPMRQDNTSTLSGLASFAKLQGLLTARGHEGCAEAKMTFEAFEVELGHAVRGLENELKAADLARYEVDTDAVLVDGKAWRKCLEQQPKTYLSASGPVTVARNLYRPADGGKLPLSAGAACRDHRGVVYACSGATGRVPDGAPDLGRDEHAVHRTGHRGSLE